MMGVWLSTEGSDVANLDTFTKWAKSPFTVALRSGLMILTPFLIGFVGYVTWIGGNDARARVAVVEQIVSAKVPAIEASIGKVAQVQVDRTKDSEAFQADVTGSISDLKAGLKQANGTISAVSEKVEDTRVAVGVIKQLVTELRQRQVADDGAPGPVPPELTTSMLLSPSRSARVR